MINNGRYIPYKADITARARQLRKNMTGSERELWFCYLKDCGIKFYRQKQIENYIIDFYCAKAGALLLKLTVIPILMKMLSAMIMNEQNYWKAMV